ncbi:MAG: acyl-CoA thioesterase [Candidatus Latescibacterota bacterium]|nr:MAG: acyl-CoA thioesterase [Candidatus Latescibacterota bacterium]
MTLHRTDITVRGFHLDLYGHVNNARYLEFLEEARWSMLDDRIDLADWQVRGLALTVVKISINYRRAASLGDKLEVRSALSEMRRKSATIQQRVFLKNTDTLVADADVTFVVVDVKSEKALPIEGDIAEALNVLRS